MQFTVSGFVVPTDALKFTRDAYSVEKIDESFFDLADIPGSSVVGVAPVAGVLL